MKRYIMRFCVWFLQSYGNYSFYPIPKNVRVMMPIAGKLCQKLEESSADGTSGEYKRHVAYAALSKKFPLIEHKDVSLAIELAWREVS